MKSPNEIVESIAAIGVTSEGRNTIALTETEDRAVGYVRQMAEELFAQYHVEPSQYEIRSDAFGNLFIMFFGEDKNHAVMSGSHVDSVRNGGKYDGVAGVASALCFLERLLQEKRQPHLSYTVAVFRSEESNPTTGEACLGSRIATGTIARDALERIRYKELDGQETTLKEHFTRRYGAERWQQILKELNEPPINRDNTASFEEVHIEQSRLGEMKEADVGIVSEGIGGARREKVRVPAEKLRKEELIVPEYTPYIRMSITTHGCAEHSGGTPPNTIWHEKGVLGDRDDGRMITRSDALVALSNLLSDIEQYRLQAGDPQKYPAHLRGQLLKFNKRAEQSGFPRWAHIARIAIPVELGITKIPGEQTMEVLLPKQHAEDFQQLIRQHAEVIEREGVSYKIVTEPIDPGAYPVIPLDHVFAAMGIAGAVANEVEMHILGRWVVNPIQVSIVGEVRATVTDFQLDPQKGLSFDIDQRNVDSAQGKKIAEEIASVVDRNLTFMGINPNESRTVISDKQPSPIDPQSVETKRRIAENLGFKTVVMPSVPGQDAGSISKVGIPTSMTYIRHPGISHNPDESVDPQYLEKAAALSHAYIEELLNKAV